MPPTKRECLQAVEDMEAGRIPHLPPDPILEHAAVKATLLTGDSKWDTFLSQLQATRQVDEQECLYFKDKLETAYGETIVMCQVNIATRKARMDLMDEIMQLPAKIVRAAHGS